MVKPGSLAGRKYGRSILICTCWRSWRLRRGQGRAAQQQQERRSRKLQIRGFLSSEVDFLRAAELKAKEIRRLYSQVTVAIFGRVLKGWVRPKQYSYKRASLIYTEREIQRWGDAETGQGGSRDLSNPARQYGSGTPFQRKLMLECNSVWLKLEEAITVGFISTENSQNKYDKLLQEKQYAKSR